MVTAAAMIMVFVFLTFATMSMVQLKEMGVGLAVAVLRDATVVRALLLPATMKLLGPRNWYLPRWLGWLPQISPVNPAAGRAAAQAAGQGGLNPGDGRILTGRGRFSTRHSCSNRFLGKRAISSRKMTLF